MHGVFAPGFDFYHNIIDIDFYSSTDQGFEDLCHQPLVSGASILEPKQHDLVEYSPCGVMKVVFSSSGWNMGI